MKKFLRVLALFLLPVALFYGLLGTVLLSSRELAPLSEVVDAAVNGSLVLYGSAYHENFTAFKLRCAQQKRAKLLVLGTSRSMQLRGAFFTEKSFFNAGGGVKNGEDYERFLRALSPEALPDTLLLVLDQNMFNAQWAMENRTEGLALEEVPLKKDVLARVGTSYGDRKFAIHKTLLPQKGVYGLAAAGRGSGFTADGSYVYGKAAEENLSSPERAFAETYRNIDFSRARFVYGDAPSEEALGWMKSLLSYCAEQHIAVIGILPPFAPSVYEKMVSSGHYRYIEILPEILKTLFADSGASCYDYSYIQNTVSAQYLDGYHGGDAVYAQMLLDLAARDTDIAPLIDGNAISVLLARGGHNPRVLP